MPYIDIIIFAVIAVLLVLRLKSVLGQRTGFEQPQEKKPMQAANDGDVVPFPSNKDEAAALNGHGLETLRKADRNFTEAAFLGGATQAFEMVLRAYAEGDLAQLKRLLGYDLLQSFTQSIQKRNANKESLTIELETIKEASILNIAVVDSVAAVTVHFHSVQTRIARDADENIIDEDESQSQEIVDIWTFERDLTLNDPNWKLVETETADDDS
ncbi:Tim44/TimA family putative adaptor protein [Candidatus Puniceispirillum sp.]|uniref:Tim44/TimA family putative adaptor protein n=1 Tax=Candidatus Puniceispirillum sp. TaxID=2026719 RepID=UPI003F69B1C4